MSALLVETAPPARARAVSRAILPLGNGDRLSSKEFLRRYCAMPSVKKAELIEGIVYMGSPVSLMHGGRDGLTIGWLASYAAKTPMVQFASNTTVILDSENTPQPDSLLRLRSEYGGKTTVNEAGLLVGPPELCVEIAVSSASIDLGGKWRAARRNGVVEYVVWLATENLIRWFVLQDEEYVEQEPDPNGMFKSVTFPGLVLAVEPALALNGARVLAVLEKAIKSKAHKDFLRRAKK
jgi:Uma2 family endonuclease